MTEQQTPKRKPWIPIIVAVLVVIAAGVYGLGKYYESRKVQEIRDAIAQIPDLTVDDISGSFFGRELTLTGIKSSVPVGGETVSFTAEKAQATGLNPQAFTSDGVHVLADTLTLTGISMEGPNYTASVASYEVSDIQGDFVRLMAAWKGALPAFLALEYRASRPYSMADTPVMREHLELLTPLFEAAETMHIGRARVEDERISFGVEGKRLDMTVASAEMTDYNLKKLGPLSIQGIMVALNGKDLLSVKTMSMAGATMPSFAGMMESSVADDPDQAFEALFAGEGLTFDGLRVQGMELLPNFIDRDLLPFVMKELVLSLTLKDKKITMTSDLSGLAFERDVLSEGDIPEEIVALLPATVVIGGQANMDITPKGNGLSDVVLKPLSLSVETLGSLSLSMDGRDLATDGYYGSDEGLLASMQLVLSDEGASDVVFQVLADEGMGASPEAARGQIVSLVAMQGASMPAPLKALAENLAAFLKEPGSTFTLNIEPSAPLSVDEIQERVMRDPASLGLSSSTVKQ